MKFIALISIVVLLSSCGSDGTSDNSSATSDIASCVERGVQYYKDIGSYPTLSSAPNAGRRAEDVVLERCSRTTTAF